MTDEKPPAKSSDDRDEAPLKNLVPTVSDAPKGQVTIGG